MTGTETSSQESDVHALKIVIGIYIIILAFKLTVYFMTGVMALFAEALHTLSDIFISSFLLIALIWSRKEADEVHMFGYGRAQNVAALVAATIFISFTSFELYREAIPMLFSPETGSYRNLPLALGMLSVSMIIAAAPLISMFRQKNKGAAAKAQLTELFRENISFLIGRSPGSDYLKNVEKTALSVEGVLGVHELRAEYTGPDTVHVGMHIDVQKGTPIEEADRIAEEVRDMVHPFVKGGFCVIHMDAAELEKSEDHNSAVVLKMFIENLKD